jgi:galactose mutarotase-like enzyme
MSRKTWTLTDVDAGVYVDQISLGSDQVGGSARGYSVTKRRLRGGLSDGVDVIEVCNGRLSFVVVPTRGMGLWRASCGGMRLGWKSPTRGPVHPALVPLWEPGGLGWLKGFDELLVRCGLESNGGPDFDPSGKLRCPLHGRIANLPAHKVEVAIDGDSGEIAVSGVADEAYLYGSKLRLTTTISTKVGQPGLAVVDEVTNISGQPGEMELLYHINFGVPLVGKGATVALPVKRLAPRDAVAVADLPTWNAYGPETPGSIEVCHFFDLAADASGKTLAVLRAADGSQGVSVKFNKRQLPCFTVWKNRQAAIDGYVTGLEPATNYPNPKSFEKQHGRVTPLAPGETRRFELAIEAHTDAASLAAAEQTVKAIQGSTTPEICPKPDPDWAAS